MKKNIYFRTPYHRPDKFKEKINNYFYRIGSYPRLVIETIIRSDMGHRYWNLYHARRVICFLFLLPIPFHFILQQSWWGTFWHNWGLYAFLALFISSSRKRHKESYQEPGEFDFSRYTKSAGRALPFFYNIKINGKTVNPRVLETVCEPIAAGIVALALLLMGQYLIGFVLLFCSIIYRMSYRAAYWMGDNMLWNAIDLWILQNEKAETFIEDKPSPAGVRFYGNKPSSKEMREEIYNFMMGMEDDESSEVR
jgi:hypothetical protein